MTDTKEKVLSEDGAPPNESAESTLYSSDDSAVQTTPAIKDEALVMDKTPTNHEDASPAAEKPTEAPLDRTPSRAQKLGKKKVIVIMIALCLVLFLAALDMTIVSTALPVMAAEFHASQSGYSWMASSYLLANAACIPLWGKISDIWGRKPIILFANAVFLVGSLVAGLSISLSMILVGRAIQGAGGGGIIVLNNICISDLFSMRERPVYYGLFGATWAVASALGPVIGGAFTTRVTWRWCFYVNLPVGGISFVILLLFLSIDTPKTPLLAGLRAIDWLGTITIMGGTLMLLFGLEFGGITYPWSSPKVICLIIFGLVLMAIFMIIEWKAAKYPVIPPRLFSNWHNIAIFITTFAHAMVFISGAYYLPLYFQTVLLVSPILSGVYTLPQVLTLSLSSAVTGVIIQKSGRYNELISGGMGLMTLGFGLFITLLPYASWSHIIPFQLIAGLGVGPNFQAPLVALQANIHPSDMASATATFGFVRQLAASMSVVFGGVVYQNILAKEIVSLEPVLGQETTSKLAGAFTLSDKGLIESLPGPQRQAILSAFTFSLSRMWIFYVCIGGFGFVTSLFIRRKVLSKSHQVAKTGLEAQEQARQEIKAQKEERKKSTKVPGKEEV